MATGAFLAQGATITIDGSAIAEVKEFGGPSISRPKVDVTHLGSTAKEYIGGLKDTGSFTFTVNYRPDDAGQLALRAGLSATTLSTFVVTLPDDPETSNPRETWTFLGSVEGFEFAASAGEAMTVDVSISVSGDVTYAVP
jgi:tail tube protein